MELSLLWPSDHNYLNEVDGYKEIIFLLRCERLINKHQKFIGNRWRSWPDVTRNYWRLSSEKLKDRFGRLLTVATLTSCGLNACNADPVEVHGLSDRA